MLTEATRLANQAQISNVTWRRLRAEDLPADLPPVRVVTFAQSVPLNGPLPGRRGRPQHAHR